MRIPCREVPLGRRFPESITRTTITAFYGQGVSFYHRHTLRGTNGIVFSRAMSQMPYILTQHSILVIGSADSYFSGRIHLRTIGLWRVELEGPAG